MPKDRQRPFLFVFAVTGIELHKVKDYILSHLGHQPTLDQEDACEELVRFLYSAEPNAACILCGYAGTGKTSLVSALIKSAPYLKIHTVLLAPTGRAAKVLAGYSGHKAYTIHKKIYITTPDPSGNLRVVRGVNRHKYTLFIVDEASMIGVSDLTGEGGYKKSLLDDLCEYVKSGDHCRLLFVGDTAQLPPVGESESPALDSRFLALEMLIKPSMAELTEVVRQKNESGILAIATKLRDDISNLTDMEPAKLPLFTRNIWSYSDVKCINGGDLEEVLYKEYSENSVESAVIICRTNKRANIYNQAIRNRILFREGEINAGDFLMVVKNNYHWLGDDSNIGFIANGDVVEVLSVRNQEDLYGFRFADVTIRFIDYLDEPTLDCKIILETLYSDSPNLSRESLKNLYSAIAEDYIDITSMSERNRAIHSNPYYNALQVKFAYALTCHKTQGGQWNTAIIEQGYLTNDMITKEYLRWLYTAVTRATKRVYLLNFDSNFFYNE